MIKKCIDKGILGTDARGFSLIEMLIAIATGLIILSAILLTTQSGLRSSTGIQANVSAQQDIRLALQVMALEIGMASFKLPQYSNQIWADLSTTSGQQCSVSTASPSDPNKKGILEATPNSITVEQDINGDGIIGSTGQPNEVIRYVFVNSGSNQYITRCTCCTSGSTGSGGQPFLGDVGTMGSARAVKIKNAELNIPLFRYYYANGTELTPDSSLTTCVSAKDNASPNAHFCNIARIDITIAVEATEKDPNTNKNKIITLSSTVIPRNHLIVQ